MRISNLLAGIAIAAAVLLTGAVAQAQKRPSGWDKGTKSGWTGDVATRLPPGITKRGGTLPHGLAKKPAPAPAPTPVP